MNTEMKQPFRVKEVGWAYPTSAIANEWIKPKGCYFVAVGETLPNSRVMMPVGETVAVFDTLSEAQKHAETLYQPYAVLAGKLLDGGDVISLRDNGPSTPPESAISALLRERDELRAQNAELCERWQTVREANALHVKELAEIKSDQAAYLAIRNMVPDPLRESATAALLFFDTQSNLFGSQNMTDLEKQIASSLRAALERTVDEIGPIVDRSCK